MINSEDGITLLLLGHSFGFVRHGYCMCMRLGLEQLDVLNYKAVRWFGPDVKSIREQGARTMAEFSVEARCFISGERG